MDKLKKIGLSALAGSLVAVSANAGEMSVSGSFGMTYSTQSGDTDGINDDYDVSGANPNQGQGIGNDKDFSRGQSEYDSFYGDRSQDGVFSTLGKLNKPPFYAVEINIGALGTNGGASTDASGRVLSASGEIIEGLYTVGNAMAGSTGSVYAGAGGTLGPALTYGFLAGKHAAGNNFLNSEGINE